MNLTEEILIEAAAKSLENANELIGEAEILKNHERTSRAYGLFQLSIEEVGKSIYCYLLLVQNNFNNKNEEKKFKTFFKSHDKKTYESTRLDLFIAQVIFKGNFVGALNFLKKSIAETRQLGTIVEKKNRSFYTSIVKDQIVIPSTQISEQMLREVEFNARTRFNAANAFITSGIKILPDIREFQKNNPNYSIDSESHAKQFWEDIMK